VASLGFLVVGPGIVAFSIYFSLLDRIGPTESNLIVYLEPVVATLLSWVVLGEVIDSTTVGGFIAIFAGFLLVKHRSLSAALAGLVGPRQRSHTDATASFSNSD
ncbi:MAG: EamA family transporter, partial [Halorhabdus sp.]